MTKIKTLLLTLVAMLASTSMFAQNVAKIGSTEYTTLSAAFAAATDGQTIELLSNCNGNGIIVAANKFTTGLTVDFKGFTYTVDGNELAGSNNTKNQCFQLLKGNKITFKDGAIVANNPNIQMMIQNYSDLTLINMNLDATQGTNNISYVVSNNCGSMTATGETNITAKPGTTAFDVCVTNYYPEGVTVTIDTEGTITGAIEYDVWGTEPPTNNTELNIENGTFDVTWNVEPALADDAEDKFHVTGGTYTNEVPSDEYLDNSFTVPSVAQIGSVNYASLAAAFAAAVDGNTITLLDDCSGNGIIVAKNKFTTTGLTVDFNNHTYTVDGSELAGSAGTENQCFQLLKGNKITFKDGAIVADNSNIQMMIQNYSDLTLINMNLDATQGTNNISYVVSNNCGSMTATGETNITAKPGTTAFDVCVTNYYPEGVTVTIDTEGTITGAIEYDVWGTEPPTNNTELNIENGTFDVTWNVEPALADDAEDKFNVSGGTFSSEVPVEFCAAGYRPKDNGNGEYTVEEGEQVTISAAGMATFCPSVDVEFPSDVEAYVIKEANQDQLSSGKLVLMRVYEAAKGEGVLVIGDEGTYPLNPAFYDLSLLGESENLLKGVTTLTNVAATDGDNTNFYLTNQGEGGTTGLGFYRLPSAGLQIGARKAYLSLPNSMVSQLSASGAKGLTFVFGDATGIKTIDNATTDNDVIYDLQGRRVQNPTRGIYVVNGKKVIIK